MGLSMFLTGCGGGISTTTPPPPTTHVLTVNSTNPASGVAITVSPADTNGATNGTTSFTRTYDAGASVTLTAPATAGGNTFSAWTGCVSANTLRECTVAMNATTTVTAGYAAPPALITPTVTVTPSASSITTAQALTVTVVVSVPSGDAAPTGTVTLTSGSYHLGGNDAGGQSSAPIIIPAGSLAVGSDTLTVIYTPDAASSSIYNGASGTSPETVLQAYVLTVNSTNPASGVSIQVTYPPTPLASQGTTSFTVSGTAGETLGLTAQATANGNNFSSWTGCTSTSTVNCNVTLNGNMTVTVNYAAAKTTPTVTVTPASSSVTTAQALAVTVAVSGGGSNPTPTGSVTLTSGAYTSTSTALAGGSATVNIPAGSLAVGSDTLTASYTPDAASAATYNTATGASSAVKVTATTTYTLTIHSAAPASGVDIQAIPADINNDGYGPTPLTLTYNPGTAVVLTAPGNSGGYAFLSWSGCATASSETCNVTMNANTIVTANYNAPNITSITVTPTAATIGTQVQFTANVVGTGSYSKAVTWTLSCSSCGSLSAGTLSAGGLYTTPYPAPATVTVKATSAAAGFTNVSGSATVALNPPATAAGPALTVDAGNQTHAISPDIYGMDAYLLDATTAKKANLAVDRWGGDSTERYNYQAGRNQFHLPTGSSRTRAATAGMGCPPVSGV